MGFSKDFLWGAASAAHQVEGAYLEDGKGPGIWDSLAEGHVKHSENGNVACDHYHRYKEDVALMKEMGLKAYRFSVSWPRIMPEEGVVNPKGVQFYQSLVAELVAAGIEPMCTLFHWNLPMWLHEKGGWAYEGISDAFEAYTQVVVDALSDKVSYWMTLNEPACFIGLGYITGSHAPFQSLLQDKQAMMETLPALTRNTLLAHGKAARVIRAHAKLAPKIGLALNASVYTPNENQNEAQARARTYSMERMVFSACMWMEPILNGALPEILESVVSAAELAIIHQPLDFFGLNSYYADDYEDSTGFNPLVYPGMPRTATGWPITPDVLYWGAKFFYEKYGLPILITENGMAAYDFVMSDGKVHDPQRIEFIKGYVGGLKRAAEEGIPVLGYTYWSVMDNFEWAEGYDMRFGLIYVNYRTGERTLKDSAYWYAKLIESNGAEI